MAVLRYGLLLGHGLLSGTPAGIVPRGFLSWARKGRSDRNDRRGDGRADQQVSHEFHVLGQHFRISFTAWSPLSGKWIYHPAGTIKFLLQKLNSILALSQVSDERYSPHHELIKERSLPCSISWRNDGIRVKHHAATAPGATTGADRHADSLTM
jgi:hypothetical protein